MDLLVFGHSGARVLVFPTRAGRFYDYENFGLVDAIRPLLDHGALQLYCVDSIDSESLYGFWKPPHERIARHTEYEGYILEEVLPFTRSLNGNSPLIAHGCSLGAYHAVNIAFRHPHLFQKVVALSGRYDLTTSVGSYRGLFDDYYDQTIYFQMPSHYIPYLNDPCILAALRHMEIILAIGEVDVFRENNHQLSTALWEKGIWNSLQIWPGEAHRPSQWRKMIRQYL
jgi:esterase/lipase superfamily enzyme